MLENQAFYNMLVIFSWQKEKNCAAIKEFHSSIITKVNKHVSRIHYAVTKYLFRSYKHVYRFLYPNIFFNQKLVMVNYINTFKYECVSCIPRQHTCGDMDNSRYLELSSYFRENKSTAMGYKCSIIGCLPTMLDMI